MRFETEPDRYQHWRLAVDGGVATLTLDVRPDGVFAPGDGAAPYELKRNSYDLGVYVELADAVQRLRFGHPDVRAVVLTSALERMFCAGANIGMLASSSHEFKVNFCKFCNETLAAIEDATSCSGQTYIAALNGTAAGGGYELAMACDQILLVDDGSSVVSLPEVPLLGVLPGTGGLTRLTDKRGVRRDLADVFATTAEGVRGERALDWRLVDEIARPSDFSAAADRMAKRVASRPSRPGGAQPGADASAAGVQLPGLSRYSTENMIAYDHIRVELDRQAGTAMLIIAGPDEVAASLAQLHDAGPAAWPLAAARELDDAITRLRFGEPELGAWLLKTTGDPAAVIATDELLAAGAADGDWLAREVIGLWKRTLWRLDATSRSLIALIEPGSCFAGTLLELALAADRQYMLDGQLEDDAPDQAAGPAEVVVGAMNTGPLPAASGRTRLEIRFGPAADQLSALVAATGKRLTAPEAAALGLVTGAPDELDWADEVRLMIAERAGFSPDALTGLEANLRSAGQESAATKIFGRLSAWQNWIFLRPNASGPAGALRRYGTGQRADFDRKRV